MGVNGYAVEKAANGAWWVRQVHGRLAWRFADRSAALRFAQQLHPRVDPPAPTPLRGPAEQGQRRGA
jgi:hypothetical protein